MVARTFSTSRLKRLKLPKKEQNLYIKTGAKEELLHNFFLEEALFNYMTAFKNLAGELNFLLKRKVKRIFLFSIKKI